VLSISFCRYSSNFSGSTSNARWFIVPIAVMPRRLATMLARTVDIPLVFQAFRTFGAAEVERSDTFHHLIVEAMCRHDATRAGALMAEHIAQGRDAVLDAMAVAE
jgi:DNA-binding GntR family transcriptional regulator